MPTSLLAKLSFFLWLDRKYANMDRPSACCLQPCLCTDSLTISSLPPCVCGNYRLLRSTRILILDEATSSTDMDTDAMVQRVIRTALKDSIVICIAHRLKSVIDYDRVVVMQDGKLVECGSPKE